MTSGVIPKTGGYPDVTERFSKTWSGGDGKKEVGTGREKWNNYSMTLAVESAQYGPQSPVVATLTLPDGTPWNASDNLRLQSKLVERIKGHSFNLAVDAAQANQLVTMCAKTIRMLGRSMLYVKRGNISAALRELGVDGRNKKLKSKDVSGRWLEMQYGWLPAVGSAYEAAKAFEALSLDRSGRVVAKVSRVYGDDANPSTNYVVPAKVFALGRIICELEEEVSFGRSLGLTDPLQVAWELTPFSFVLDWFLPIGSYLENLAIIPSLKARFCQTVKEGYTAYYASSTISSVPPGIKRVGHGLRVTRTISTSLTTQRPRFADPIKAMTYKRIANAVSLAHQLIGS